MSAGEEVQLQQLLDLIRENFRQKLGEKTGWGRNEVLSTYDNVVSTSVLQFTVERLKEISEKQW